MTILKKFALAKATTSPAAFNSFITGGGLRFSNADRNEAVTGFPWIGV